MWEVFSTGRFERIRLPAQDERWAGDVDKGTTEPVPSPDQRFVAYIRAGNVWLYDLDADTAHQLTKLALLGNDTTAAAFLWIAGWSTTGTRLLVYLDHEEVEDPESFRPNLVVQPADFDYYSCDVNLSECSAVMLPGVFQAWLPSGEFLLTTKEPLRENRWLIRYDAQSRTSVPVGSAPGWLLQLDVASSGDRALVLAARGTNAIAPAGIFTLDFSSGSLTPLTPAGSWGEYQRPRYSPSAHRVAYVRRVTGTQETVVIDGRPVYPCKAGQGGCLPHWISEQVLAVQESDIVLERGLLRSQALVLTVLDVNTGQVKAVDTLGVDRPARRCLVRPPAVLHAQSSAGQRLRSNLGDGLKQRQNAGIFTPVG